MKISFDLNTYKEYRLFFDALAISMQSIGHKVGIITGHRDRDIYNNADLKEVMVNDLGFKPDFVYMWGQNESIANGNLWKAQRMDMEDVYVHFDEDAREIKKYTDRWVFKSLNSASINKF